MQKLIQIGSFSPESLADDSFSTGVPEFYKLKDVIESNDWHANQNIFDHSLDTARALRDITRFEYLTSQESVNLHDYLAQYIDTHTRKQLLMMATLLHDIGKSISLQRNTQGNTTSPSHGILGSWVAKPFLERFELSAKEKVYILDLIADHLVASDLIELSINNNTGSQWVVDLLQNNRPQFAIEILVLGYADWIGCDIRNSAAAAERDKRVVIARDCLSVMAKARQ